MKLSVILLLLFSIVSAYAATYYISLDGKHMPPFANWENAATNIQLAVDITSDGDHVIVSNGIYNVGGRWAPNNGCLSRVMITNAIVLESLNGADYTAIVGEPDPITGANGTNGVRGVYLGESAHLKGFTVSNGYTGIYSSRPALFGNGIFADDNATVSWCKIMHNIEADGDYVAICSEKTLYLFDTIISHNYGYDIMYAATGYYRNVICYSNKAFSVYHMSGIVCIDGIVDTCTSIDNNGQGLFVYPDALVRNSIIYDNINNYGFITNFINYNNCIMDWPQLINGIITNDPQFVNPAAGDYRLSDTSPCINAGTNMPWMWSATDLDGNPRIEYDIVDMGCYESLVPEPAFLLIAPVLIIFARRTYNV